MEDPNGAIIPTTQDDPSMMFPEWRNGLLRREKYSRKSIIEHPITYLACPYSHPSPNIMQARFEAVNIAAVRLMRRGHIVFSPISHSHPICKAGCLPGTWEYWERFDRAFIAVCQQFFILKLNGWASSVGVSAEVEIAKNMGIRIQYIDP